MFHLVTSNVQEHFVLQFVTANNLPQLAPNDVDVLQMMTQSESTGLSAI